MGIKGLNKIRPNIYLKAASTPFNMLHPTFQLTAVFNPFHCSIRYFYWITIYIWMVPRTRSGAAQRLSAPGPESGYRPPGPESGELPSPNSHHCSGPSRSRAVMGVGTIAMARQQTSCRMIINMLFIFLNTSDLQWIIFHGNIGFNFRRKQIHNWNVYLLFSN